MMTPAFCSADQICWKWFFGQDGAYNMYNESTTQVGKVNTKNRRSPTSSLTKPSTCMQCEESFALDHARRLAKAVRPTIVSLNNLYPIAQTNIAPRGILHFVPFNEFVALRTSSPPKRYSLRPCSAARPPRIRIRTLSAFSSPLPE